MGIKLRLGITLDSDLLDQIDRRRALTNRSRSQWLAKAALLALVRPAPDPPPAVAMVHAEWHDDLDPLQAKWHQLWVAASPAQTGARRAFLARVGYWRGTQAVPIEQISRRYGLRTVDWARMFREIHDGPAPRSHHSGRQVAVARPGIPASLLEELDARPRSPAAVRGCLDAGATRSMLASRLGVSTARVIAIARTDQPDYRRRIEQ